MNFGRSSRQLKRAVLTPPRKISVPFKQGAWSGLCGVYAVINALTLLFPGSMTQDKGGELYEALLDAVPCGPGEALRVGTDRQETTALLRAARLWTQAQDWLLWSFSPIHPHEGMSATDFWNEVAIGLARRRTVALVGFGDDPAPGTEYEPHWTVVHAVRDGLIHLYDSSVYDSVCISVTSIAPAVGGWRVEDCFLLHRGE